MTHPCQFIRDPVAVSIVCPGESNLTLRSQRINSEGEKQSEEEKEWV